MEFRKKPVVIDATYEVFMTCPDSKATREGDVHTRDGDATLWEIVEDAVRDARFRERAGRATGSDLCMITLANRLTAAEQENKALREEVRWLNVPDWYVDPENDDYSNSMSDLYELDLAPDEVREIAVSRGVGSRWVANALDDNEDSDYRVFATEAEAQAYVAESLNLAARKAGKHDAE